MHPNKDYCAISCSVALSKHLSGPCQPMCHSAISAASEGLERWANIRLKVKLKGFSV